MLVVLLERLELVLRVTVTDAFLVEQLRELPTVESVRLEEVVALLNDAVLLDDRCPSAVELADSLFEFALQLRDGLERLAWIRVSVDCTHLEQRRAGAAEITQCLPQVILQLNQPLLPLGSLNLPR